MIAKAQEHVSVCDAHTGDFNDLLQQDILQAERAAAIIWAESWDQMIDLTRNAKVPAKKSLEAELAEVQAYLESVGIPVVVFDGTPSANFDDGDFN